MEDFILYRAISSANIFTSLSAEMTVATSLIYSINRSGPRTEPWGTPEITGRICESTPSILTYWLLLDK